VGRVPRHDAAYLNSSDLVLAQQKLAHHPAYSLSRRDRRVLRPILLLLAALAATLTTALLGSTATLGATALAAQNRAGAFNPPGVAFARGPSAENPCSRLDSNSPGGGIAAGCFVGDEDAAALDAADDAADTFLPDEYYATKENDLAPGQSSPYSTYERFSPNGDLKQVTTYDEYGDRAYQYDLGEGSRHGEGSHFFEYSGQNPRQAPGGGLRGEHVPFE
jgi:hypothetical protein